MEYTVSPLGDKAIVMEFGEDMSDEIQKQIRTVSACLDDHPLTGMVEYIPAYTTITIFYNVMEVLRNSTGTNAYHMMLGEIEKMVSRLPENPDTESNIVEIPVCYGGEFGPDLEVVAHENNLTEQEVIDIHVNGDYTVYMIGFAPGFPFIGGMSKQIATPRKDSPRLHIPAGSVGIAGSQTGVYPIETPGGWQLIGRTPVKLFRPDEEVPILLKAGDSIRFFPISEEQYSNWGG
ncbi:5-oxoprolinase subunit PxpB [Virgibacillus ihumii]|uniref:5-oxoprolinase subunit PxpB n=1 Tax=Virgibacillus ihumii TaxID=2686091 RepID=UPI00157D2718|nr:5-oxoprolinase subunit PxpB [Virgibacillus ihumii]